MLKFANLQQESQGLYLSPSLETYMLPPKKTYAILSDIRIVRYYDSKLQASGLQDFEFRDSAR